jgi:hypothetical protein
MLQNVCPAIMPEGAARLAAIRCAHERGAITQSKMLRYYGIPYGDSGRALCDLQAEGEISGPEGEHGERSMKGVAQ